MPRVRVPLRERYRTSRLIFRQTVAMLRRERDLWWFPTAAAAATLLAIVPLSLLGFWAGTGTGLGTAMLDLPAWAFPLLLMLALLPVMYPFMVLAGLLNAALQFAAHERMHGRACTKREAWRRALSCIGPIARFNLVAMLVAGVLGIVGQLLDRLRIVPWLGQALQAVGSLAWAVAAFFVIPIIVVEGERSALAALRGSTTLARSQWGKATAGIVTVSLFIMVPVMVMAAAMFAVAFAVPWMALAGGVPFAALLPVLVGVTVMFLVFTLGAVSLGGMVSSLYQVGLYAFARTGRVVDPYTRETLVDAWAPYRQG